MVKKMSYIYIRLLVFELGQANHFEKGKNSFHGVFDSNLGKRLTKKTKSILLKIEFA